MLNAPCIVLPMTEQEQNRLRDCENILRRGLRVFLEVGNALLTIREQKLFRATHPTFERYCKECWGICRSYAWRVMGAAERIRLLPESCDLPRPANEFQIRPFLKLELEEFPGCWQEVINRAKDGKVTPGLVRQVVKERLPRDSQGSVGKGHIKPGKSKSHAQLGQILALLNEAKRNVQTGDTDQVLEALERIETLLFGQRVSELEVHSESTSWAHLSGQASESNG